VDEGGVESEQSGLGEAQTIAQKPHLRPSHSSLSRLSHRVCVSHRRVVVQRSVDRLRSAYRNLLTARIGSQLLESFVRHAAVVLIGHVLQLVALIRPLSDRRHNHLCRQLSITR
jgi:hypothetical protein